MTLGGFAIGNIVDGAADLLSGLVTSDPASIFSLGSPFAVGPLGAGATSGLFGIGVDTQRIGRFTGEIDFAGVGTNASDPTGEQRYATLFVTGTVVPEPAQIALLGLGVLGVIATRRRSRL